MKDTFDVRVSTPGGVEYILRNCTSMCSNLGGMQITYNTDDKGGWNTYQVGYKCKVEVVAMR